MVKVRFGIPKFEPDGSVRDKNGATLSRKQNYDDLPPRTTIVLIKDSNGLWPGVPTDRADTIIIWKGAEPSPPIVQSRVLGDPGMLDNVDIRMIV